MSVVNNGFGYECSLDVLGFARSKRRENYYYDYYYDYYYYDYYDYYYDYYYDCS